MNKLIKEICKREAGKSEVSVGNVRSILKHLVEVMMETPGMSTEFAAYLRKAMVKREKQMLKKRKK